TGQGMDGQFLALLGPQGLGGTRTDKEGLCDDRREGRIEAHVCFLHETGPIPTTSLGETDTFGKAQLGADLAGSEPSPFFKGRCAIRAKPSGEGTAAPNTMARHP